MRRPPSPILALIAAGLFAGAALLSAAAATDGDRLQTTTAAAMMPDEPGGSLRAMLGGLRVASRLDEALRGADAARVAPGIRGAAPAAVAVGLRPPAGEDPSDNPLASRSELETLTLLEDESPGTYMNELLRSGNALTRWPARSDRAIRIWVQPGAGLADYTPAHRRLVAEAFQQWERAGIPLRFDQVRDSAAADVVIVWTSRFAEPISGKTRWTHDRRGWIRSARVMLALHRYTGELLDDEAIRAIALHEVGHALGLDHTTDATNVMAPKVRVRELSDEDRATVRLLYRLPPGLRR